MSTTGKAQDGGGIDRRSPPPPIHEPYDYIQSRVDLTDALVIDEGA